MVVFPKKLLALIMRFVWQKNWKLWRLEKLEIWGRKNVFFSRKKRFHPSKLHLYQIGKAQNMTVVGGCLVDIILGSIIWKRFSYNHHSYSSLKLRKGWLLHRNTSQFLELYLITATWDIVTTHLRSLWSTNTKGKDILKHNKTNTRHFISLTHSHSLFIHM